MAQPKTQTPVVKLLTEDDLLVLTQAFHDRLDQIERQNREILDRIGTPRPRSRHAVLKPSRP